MLQGCVFVATKLQGLKVGVLGHRVEGESHLVVGEFQPGELGQVGKILNGSHARLIEAEVFDVVQFFEELLVDICYLVYDLAVEDDSEDLSLVGVDVLAMLVNDQLLYIHPANYL